MPPQEDFSDDESYYVPAGTSPPRVVRGPSVRDMQLYGSENRDLLRTQRSDHARLMAAMRRRQGQTPVDAIRTRIQRASRRHIAKELDPETVRRRAASVDASADVFRDARRERLASVGEAPGVDRRGTDDGMRHLPEVSYGAGTVNPDPAASMARRVARQLAKVQAPHVPWEGTTSKTKRLSSLPT